MPKDVLTAALDHLAGARHPRADAVRVVPAKPGLYAFYGDPQAWTDLALSPTFGGQPLYVGKAERSLNGRDIGTHFATGKTGSSTVRRSLAALLAGRFELVPVPRNLAKPDGSANYALESSSDAPLSAWVEERLTLAFWVQSPESLVLDEVETAVVRRLRPPLNLDKVGERRDRLRAARRRMADLARTWPVDLPNAGR